MSNFDGMTKEEIEERIKVYEDKVLELQCKYGWSRGKARRALEAHSKKVLKKFNKSVKMNQGKEKIYIDPTTMEISNAQ